MQINWQKEWILVDNDIKAEIVCCTLLFFVFSWGNRYVKTAEQELIEKFFKPI